MMPKLWMALPIFLAETTVGCPGPPGPIPPTRLPMMASGDAAVVMLTICVFGLLVLMQHHPAEAHRSS